MSEARGGWSATRLAFQLAVGLLGASALYVGLANLLLGVQVLAQFYGPIADGLSDAARAGVDVQLRILGGAWLGVGVLALAALRRFERHTLALRVAFLSFALSALGDLASLLELGGDASSRLTRVAAQLGLCAGMEAWRWALVRRPSRAPSGG